MFRRFQKYCNEYLKTSVQTKVKSVSINNHNLMKYTGCVRFNDVRDKTFKTNIFYKHIFGTDIFEILNIEVTKRNLFLLYFETGCELLKQLL